MNDYAPKLWLHRRRPIPLLDWLTFGVYAAGLALILRWIP